MYTESLSKKLKYSREKYNFSQSEVSIETQIPRETISRIESGKRLPTIEQLGLLADFYCVSVDWLLGTKGNNKNE